jgi:hypothetical protein
MVRTSLTSWWPDARAGGTWGTRIRPRRNELAAAWASFLGRVPWTFMATLTFDPKRVRSANQGRANRDAFWWCCLLGKMYCRPISWVYVTERHRSGRWHAHVLITGLTRAEANDAAEVWRAARGIAHVQGVYDGKGAVFYVAKDEAKQVPYRSEIVISGDIIAFKDQLRPEITVQLSEAPSPYVDSRRRDVSRSGAGASEEHVRADAATSSDLRGDQWDGPVCELCKGPIYDARFETDTCSDRCDVILRMLDSHLGPVKPQGTAGTGQAKFPAALSAMVDPDDLCNDLEPGLEDIR